MTKVYFNHWFFRLPFIKNSNYGGITLGSRILLKREVIAISPLLRHELIHIDQIKQHGAFRFYTRYLWEFLKLLCIHRDLTKAYLKIPFEVEAYAKQYNTRGVQLKELSLNVYEVIASPLVS